MQRLPYVLLSLVLIAFDRVTKWWAADGLALGWPRPLVGDLVRLTRVHNIGGAFGIFPGNGTLFLAVSAAVSLVLAVLLLSPRLRGALLRTGMAIVLAGAVGNLIDRLLFGYVLDFVEFRGLFVFNLADACITIGAAIILIRMLLGGGGNRTRREADCL